MKKLFKLPILLILLLSLFIAGCSNSKTDISTSNNLTSGKLVVHYIDVGQGDSILIQTKDKNFLIDAGPKENEDKLLSYLKKINIKRLDYVVATHPHEDHIGGMTNIIKTYDIGKFYAPKVTNTTKTFQNMLLALKDKNKNINVIKPGMGDDIDLGENTKVEVFSPNSSKYDDLNNYSPIIKVTYGKNSFLFTGDAEKLEESEVLQKKYDIKADVLKVGHHGSSSSTGKDFLSKVSPSIAVISCGKGNDYGHPHKETLKTLEDAKVKVYRTDISGTIVITSDGNNIAVK
ncbi:ComEC/Rec2 family competence protein [Clostridium folliculivorans]|uniref:Metallo beta-lactamase superfamily lipoprotein n=1 Tax=Clostridium folliculivorans TaxID=2886038 RepID=A0A9W5Y2J4_9CLOT|nr:ComEC/Rec2 family competence protein [Clostridium folliculivorans]GKU25388.1 metallo beta-lactamase superfamily lipoprotein [Clostridium folliculivorans]GKU28410.1 metallo beta-lactamase superfamily lipoprotein [Clostridium folliculivorans]